MVYEEVLDDLDRLQVFTSVVEGDAVDTEQRYSDEYLALPEDPRYRALSDIIVTSSNAEYIINQIPKDQPIIFAPDRNLGAHEVSLREGIP